MTEERCLENYNALHKTFLQVVRLGIGTSNDAKVPDDVDWVQLKALADVQGLSAVVFDGLNQVLKSNPQFSFFNARLKLSWIGEVVQNYEQRYSKYDGAERLCL